MPTYGPSVSHGPSMAPSFRPTVAVTTIAPSMALGNGNSEQDIFGGQDTYYYAGGAVGGVMLIALVSVFFCRSQAGKKNGDTSREIEI